MDPAFKASIFASMSAIFKLLSSAFNGASSSSPMPRSVNSFIADSNFSMRSAKSTIAMPAGQRSGRRTGPCGWSDDPHNVTAPHPSST